MSVNSLSTRESTNADYDPLNMVDALLRANPDAFGDLRPTEDERHRVSETSGVLRSSRGQREEDEVKIMASV